MSTAISHSFQVGSQTVTLETNRIAKQAQASVWVSCKKTRVLVTLCLQSQGEGYKDFLPLTVHYQERAYAAGAIPGSFFRREGRPSESEVLSSRLIDRSVRPLAHELFFDDMQLLAQVMSYDPEGVSAEVLAMIGASAAVAISGAPFEGPFGVAHVGFDGKAPFLLSDCASAAQQESQLNLVAAGIQGKQHMIESEAQGVSEANMLDALAFAQTKIDEMTGHIEAFAALKGAKSTWLWEGAPLWDGAAYKAIDAAHGNKVAEVFNIQDKAQRYAAKDEWKQAVLNEYKDHETVSASSVLAILKDIERNHVRKQLLEGKPRIDGRDHKTVRPISIELGVLPQSHGSALFTRGETQAIVSVVMGSEKMAQMLDGLDGNKNNTFMLHYNFPSYCVGEVGMVSSPKRREIGHGNLARRALKSGIPDKESFPYVLRIVSEITESNGSRALE